MEKTSLFHKDIINFNIEAIDSTDAIRQLGKNLVEHSYINDSYTDSVLEREQSFPTGLVLANTGIAIPHASPNDNITKNGIAVARLAKPVEFYCMEDPDKKVPVNMIFLLALASSGEHLEILKKLFVAFQNQKLVDDLEKSTDKTEFLNLLITNIQ